MGTQALAEQQFISYIPIVYPIHAIWQSFIISLSWIYVWACPLHIEGWPWRMRTAGWLEDGSLMAGWSHVGRKQEGTENIINVSNKLTVIQ